MFLRRLKGVSRQSQRHSKEVSRVFKESVKCVLRNFKQKVSRVFQNVSIKFCFAILFLHESHRSYPSRRRACFFCLLCLLSMAFVTVWVKSLQISLLLSSMAYNLTATLASMIVHNIVLYPHLSSKSLTGTLYCPPFVSLANIIVHAITHPIIQ